MDWLFYSIAIFVVGFEVGSIVTRQEYMERMR